MKKRKTSTRPKVKKAKKKTGKFVNVMGSRVSEAKLNATIRDVIDKRGLKGSLILEKSMTAKEKIASLSEDGTMYGNVYKYAFF